VSVVDNPWYQTFSDPRFKGLSAYFVQAVPSVELTVVARLETKTLPTRKAKITAVILSIFLSPFALVNHLFGLKLYFILMESVYRRKFHFLHRKRKKNGELQETWPLAIGFESLPSHLHR
jgi:hypothetical protein